MVGAGVLERVGDFFCSSAGGVVVVDAADVGWGRWVERVLDHDLVDARNEQKQENH